MNNFLKLCVILISFFTLTFTFARGGIHYVRSYTKSNGTYVQGHYAGNPGSGIHCHHNACH